MPGDNMNDLAEKYQGLRNDPNASQEDKYAVMKALGDQLGLPGTPAADILPKLGKPDELTPSLDGNNSAFIQTMPGPMIPNQQQANTESKQPPYYLVYYLKPKEQYLYFKVDSEKETVITSGWKK
ncbi:hypothetical protein BDF20DRAFT_915300 [Mycotypha africana]|uniref:uncharacterized protein n=1 Tax=Mycotypha africana TaxID=64632 RepID=UPI002300DAF6|nr:uncharacterized protein BDF20DRAFT_915300 [Mycotypha africana]KAI8971485.1 hypothetical protein BDF20DRAFT_915300 [Mycotypha africana]